MSQNHPEQPSSKNFAAMCYEDGRPAELGKVPYGRLQEERRLFPKAEQPSAVSKAAQEVFKKNDQDKPRTDLLPAEALLKVAEVLGFGASKYGEENWRNCKDMKRYIGAALRHILAYQAGYWYDKESGKEHLAHAACCLLFILDLETEDER